MSRSVHCFDSANGLAGFPMSEQCTQKRNSVRRFSSDHEDISVPSNFTHALKSCNHITSQPSETPVQVPSGPIEYDPNRNAMTITTMAMLFMTILLVVLLQIQALLTAVVTMVFYFIFTTELLICLHGPSQLRFVSA
jgi:hypothetical protein